MIQPKNYPYQTNLVSELDWHNHLQLYNGYVEIVNNINQNTRGMKTAETYNLNGVILHELFFENIGYINQSINGQNILSRYYDADFEYYPWEQEFIAVAMLTRGWVILIFDPRSNKLRTTLLDEHDKGVISETLPILVLDMYEHAYIGTYGTDKLSYINTFMQCILWEEVERRLQNIVHYQQGGVIF